MSEKSIDLAIKNLEVQIEQHRLASRRIIVYAMFGGVFLLIFGFFIFVYQDYRTTNFSGSLGGVSGGIYLSDGLGPGSEATNGSSEGVNNKARSPAGGGSVNVNSGFSGDFYAPSTTILYVFVLLFVVVFGVMMAIYRFHLSEISRSEQLKVGFMRVRIAANNYDNQGFATEVRMALTDNAFTFQSGKDKKVESPLPGHPGSDLGALLVNKLLESIDFKVTKKD